MRPKRKQRLIFVSILLIGFSSATALGVYALQKNKTYFHTPAEINAGGVEQDILFRVGGLVVEGSVNRFNDGVTTEFDLTDTEGTVTLRYKGLLPDLFREGQGIVAQGKLNADGIIVAQEVLAKHDENYMPPEVADALKASGSSHPENIPKKNY
ncbi:MAG: cytochrome c maturation protein CcmE [Gammaproteobacteria bacterium]